MGEVISIPVDEYHSLLRAAEELADLRSYDAVKSQLAVGEEELISSDVVDRLLAGTSALRVWREYRGHTQMALAGLSGVNRVQIADIEAGRKTGSVETVKKLAGALGVTLDDLTQVL